MLVIGGLNEEFTRGEHRWGACKVRHSWSPSVYRFHRGERVSQQGDWCAPGKIVAEGHSAGGTLIGAVGCAGRSSVVP
jgi:hypothetical protein